MQAGKDYRREILERYDLTSQSMQKYDKKPSLLALIRSQIEITQKAQTSKWLVGGAQQKIGAIDGPKKIQKLASGKDLCLLLALLTEEADDLKQKYF